MGIAVASSQGNRKFSTRNSEMVFESVGKQCLRFYISNRAVRGDNIKIQRLYYINVYIQLYAWIPWTGGICLDCQ